MIRCVKRHRPACVLALLTVLGAGAAGPASGHSETDGDYRPPAHTAQTDSGAGFVTTGWTLQPGAQLAVVGAGNGGPGTFAGIQCDPFDPQAHRLIFGAARTGQSSLLLALFRNPGVKLVINTTAPSLTAQFEIYPEDRGQSNFRGVVDYVATYLSQRQFDVLNTARSFTIQAGTRSYSFSGNGSERAIGGMACQTGARHVATRLIERRREDASQQHLAGWQLVFHSGPTALVNGRAEAFASTTNHPANTAASFRMAVSCADRRLYAHLDVGLDPAAIDGATSARTNSFVREFEQHGKLVEIYRAGHRIGAFLIESNAMAGHGHALSRQDLVSLMEADALAVVGDNKVVEFSTANAPESLANLSNACHKMR
jgi:hypothetical protein